MEVAVVRGVRKCPRVRQELATTGLVHTWSPICVKGTHSLHSQWHGGTWETTVCVLVLAEPPLPDSLLHGAARQGSHRQRLMANGLVTNIEGRYLPCAPLHFKRQGRHFVHVNRASRNMTTPIVSPNMTSPILKDTS